MQPPLAECSFPRVGCGDPIVHGTRNNPDRVRRFRFLPDGNQELGAVTLLRVNEGLDLIERRLVQVDMLAQSSHIARLLPNDFRGRVLYDSCAMLVGLVGSADKIFGSLADPPDARIAL